MNEHTVGGSDEIISFSRETFSTIEGERPIRTPARDMCIRAGDLPVQWEEQRVSVMEQPKFGQRDYASRRFTVAEDGVEKAAASFETVVYKDQRAAADVFSGTLRKMGFLQTTRLDMGDMAAVIEAPGHPSRRLRALVFAERNVMGLIMLSTVKEFDVSNSWLISMGRLMMSRTR